MGCKTWEECLRIEDAHSAHIKGMVVLTRKDDVNADDPYLLATASSDEVVCVWDVRMAMKEKPNPLAEVNPKSRLTCPVGSSLKSLKRPQIQECRFDHLAYQKSPQFTTFVLDFLVFY